MTAGLYVSGLFIVQNMTGALIDWTNNVMNAIHTPTYDKYARCNNVYMSLMSPVQARAACSYDKSQILISNNIISNNVSHRQK